MCSAERERRRVLAEPLARPPDTIPPACCPIREAIAIQLAAHFLRGEAGGRSGENPICQWSRGWFGATHGGRRCNSPDLYLNSYGIHVTPSSEPSTMIS